jgi:hypothetical protein
MPVSATWNEHEAVPVQAALHLIDDRRRKIAAAQEVGVQRMAGAAFDRPVGRNQALAEHLTAEYLRAADVAAGAAEQVDLELLELE